MRCGKNDGISRVDKERMFVLYYRHSKTHGFCGKEAGEIMRESMLENEAAEAACADMPCAGDFVEAGFAGCATADTIRRFGWERILHGLRALSLGSSAAALAREAARLYVPEVWRRLLGMIAEGSVPAVKLYMELCKDAEPEPSHGAPYGEEAAIRQLREAIFSPQTGLADEQTTGGGSAREVTVGG